MDNSPQSEPVSSPSDTDGSFFDRHADKIAADPNTGCWHWTGVWVGSTNHGRVWSNGSMLLAHRVSYQSVFGAIPDGLIVRHKCDVGCCVNPDHLEVGTIADNSRDMFDRGRVSKEQVAARLPASPCESNGRSKLCQSDIDQIRRLRAEGVSCQKVADRFGVTKSYVSKVARRIRWLDDRGNEPHKENTND